MSELIWWILGLIMLVIMVNKFGTFQDIPVNIVIILAMFFIIGAIFLSKRN